MPKSFRTFITVHWRLPVLMLVGLALFMQSAVLLKNLSLRKNPSVWTEVELLAQKAHDGRTAMLSPHEIADLLVECIIQIESGGNPGLVGTVGERGLMQVRSETWAEVTTRQYGAPLSFDLAFDPEVNEAVGRLYLDYLQVFLHQHREHWQADERALLLASYNAGPGRVQRAGFDLKKLPAIAQDYVKRGVDLHDHLLAEQASYVRHMLVSYFATAPTDG